MEKSKTTSNIEKVQIRKTLGIEVKVSENEFQNLTKQAIDLNQQEVMENILIEQELSMEYYTLMQRASRNWMLI